MICPISRDLVLNQSPISTIFQIVRFLFAPKLVLSEIQGVSHLKSRHGCTTKCSRPTTLRNYSFRQSGCVNFVIEPRSTPSGVNSGMYIFIYLVICITEQFLTFDNFRKSFRWNELISIFFENKPWLKQVQKNYCSL